MTSSTIDEAVRRLIAVGGRTDHIGGVDNFCWPNIQYHPVDNPDGRFKAAQLVRACRALKDMCMAYEIPLLSGKDSMYVDGHLTGRYGEVRKVSALETLQFTAIGVVPDVCKCTTMDSKMAGDRVYVLGITRDELGASEYYAHLGYTGCNVPQVCIRENLELYRALEQAVAAERVASVHGIYRGGLGVHLAQVAMGGQLGLTVELKRVPGAAVVRDDQLLFSESTGRFIVTVAPENTAAFESLMAGQPAACIGEVTEAPVLKISGLDGREIIQVSVQEMKAAWKRPFGDLI
jgi:phosphoribosylformylglycinamidine synthase